MVSTKGHEITIGLLTKKWDKHSKGNNTINEVTAINFIKKFVKEFEVEYTLSKIKNILSKTSSEGVITFNSFQQTILFIIDENIEKFVISEEITQLIQQNITNELREEINELVLKKEQSNARLNEKEEVKKGTFTCDYCSISIVGRRYHCLQCRNFDLCPKCIENWEESDHGGKAIWSAHQTPEGHDYYYNSTTKKSQWNLPHNPSHYHRWFDYEVEVNDGFLFQDEDLNNLVWQNYTKAFNKYRNRPFLGYRKDKNSFNEEPSGDHFHWITYGEVKEIVEKFASGLNYLSIKAKEFVTISTNICYQWIVAEMSLARQNYVIVPIETSLSIPVIRHILRSTQSVAHICNYSLLDKYLDLLHSNFNEQENNNNINNDDNNIEEKINIKNIIIVEEVEFNDYQRNIAKKLSISLYTFNQIISIGEKNKVEENISSPSDLYTLTYTSGSTGIPKAVQFSNYNYNRRMCVAYVASAPLVTICYCSFAHFTDRQTFFFTLAQGGSVGLFSNDMKFLFHDFQCIRPTLLSTTPHIYNELFAEYKEELNQIMRSLSDEEKNDQNRIYYIKDQLQRKTANKLGGRLENIGVGGAPPSPIVLNFLKEVFRVSISHGYGATEVGPIYDFSNGAYNDVEYKLIDVPDLNYFANNDPPQGEILIRSPYSATGYFKDKENTEKSFDKEGYWHTGDIGEISNENGKPKLRIIDRIKNVFKLAQGKFIAPEKIEAVLLKSKYIYQSYVYGNSVKWYVVAIIIPQQNVLIKFAEEKKIEFSSFEDLCANHLIQTEIFNDIQRIGKELTPIEVPKNIFIHSEAFEKENGLLTNSFKMNRLAIEKKFKIEIENLYNDDNINEFDDHLNEYPVNNSSNEEKLLWILRNQLEIKSKFLSEKSTISFDSLTVSRFISIIREKFNVEIPLFFIMQNPSISDISHYISYGKISENSSIINRMIEDLNIDFSSSLSPHYIDDNNINIIQNNNENNENNENFIENNEESFNIDYEDTLEKDNSIPLKFILLTGATGFIGLFLLQNLLIEFPQSKIICLIRDRSINDAQKRFFSLLQKANIHLSEEDKKRISIILFDMEKEKLNLSPKNYEYLCKNVHVIYHSAAYINSMFSYIQLRKMNFLASIELLKIAKSNFVKPFFYLSTLGVLYDPSLMEEDDLEFSKIQYLNGYSQTKFIFEKYLQKTAKEFQIPFLIFRPGMVSGHSTSGYLNPTDFFNRLLIGFIQLESYINKDSIFDITPVDFVAKFIVYTSKQYQYYGKVFHITNRANSLSLSQLGQMLSQFGYPLTPLSSLQFYEKLISITEKNQSQNSALDSIKPYFSGGNFDCDSGEKHFDNTKKIIYTSNYSLQFPTIDQNIIFSYLKFLISVRSIDPPK